MSVSVAISFSYRSVTRIVKTNLNRKVVIYLQEKEYSKPRGNDFN